MLPSVLGYLVSTQEYASSTKIYLHLPLINLHLYRGETRNGYKILDGESHGKRPLGGIPDRIILKWILCK
jgi:hypothetical protein